MKLILLIPFLLFIPILVYGEPLVVDKNFKVEKFVSNLSYPTTMSFVGEDLLVLEKFSGNVRIVKNGILLDQPALHVNVDSRVEQGLLGITNVGNTVYLYFTEADENGDSIGNRIYKYDWDGNELINPILIKELPSHIHHNGGAMVVGLDNQVYAVIGDVGKSGSLQNKIPKTTDYMDTSVILRVDPEGPYHAIGIRNSFGLAIDPINGNLWDTENGEQTFDEINLIEPKFNSGWRTIMGPDTKGLRDTLPNFSDFQYSDPEFSWGKTVGPTGIIFVDSEMFRDYQDSVFVGEFHTGMISKFQLNSERTGFVFENPLLGDLVIDFVDPQEELVFALGFRGVTDLEFGPDGLLYVISMGDGTVYRILPNVDTFQTKSITIPPWIKNPIFWWSDNQINEKTFLGILKYLIEKNIIVISNIPTIEKGNDQVITERFKQNSSLWASDLISKEEFASSIETLIKFGALDVNSFKCNKLLETHSDFSDCDLSNIVISEVDISYSNFINVKLMNSTIDKSKMSLVDFSLVDFSGASITSSTIVGSNFQNATLWKTKINNSIFENSKMMDMTLSESILVKTLIKNTDLRNSKLNNLTIEKGGFERSNLSNTDLTNLKMKGSRIFSSVVQNSEISNSTILISTFKHTDFSNSNMSNSNLSGSDFWRGKLINVDLRNSDLTDVSFVEADLSGADLTGAKIINTNFLGANMTNCKGCPQD